MAFVYMLECADGSFYVGSTVLDIQAREFQHQEGLGAAYTARRRPVRLVWFEEHEHIGAAFAREKQIQNWGRAKRIALIEQRWTTTCPRWLASVGSGPWLTPWRAHRVSTPPRLAARRARPPKGMPSGSAGSTTERRA